MKKGRDGGAGYKGARKMMKEMRALVSIQISCLTTKRKKGKDSNLVGGYKGSWLWNGFGFSFSIAIGCLHYLDSGQKEKSSAETLLSNEQMKKWKFYFTISLVHTIQLPDYRPFWEEMDEEEEDLDDWLEHDLYAVFAISSLAEADSTEVSTLVAVIVSNEEVLMEIVKKGGSRSCSRVLHHRLRQCARCMGNGGFSPKVARI
ncbi:hypothetical protein VNO78_26972 [Psophocarpus tetragonolobus]|uniref:Uncharacterized protein n=1 Tax=Psophocarpus tetragonolobus TaxID=3891 RepID=A0AAN9X985_PSOTE